MKDTGVKVTKEDFEKLQSLARSGWMQGDRVMVFSVGEGLRKNQKTLDAKKVCHQLALDYGLPEIQGYYGLTQDGEFITC